MTITREELETGQFVYTDPDIDIAGPRLLPVHPGDVLRQEFMEPLGISGYRLSTDIHVPDNRISEMLRGRRAMTADTAIRLGRYFGNAPAFWMNLQTSFDLQTVMQTRGQEIARDVSARGM